MPKPKPLREIQARKRAYLRAYRQRPHVKKQRQTYDKEYYLKQHPPSKKLLENRAKIRVAKTLVMQGTLNDSKIAALVGLPEPTVSYLRNKLELPVVKKSASFLVKKTAMRYSSMTQEARLELIKKLESEADSFYARLQELKYRFEQAEKPLPDQREAYKKAIALVFKELAKNTAKREILFKILDRNTK